MTAPAPLTADRKSSIRRLNFGVRPLAAAVKVFKNGLASCWGTGYYGPAGSSGNVSTESAPVGRFYETVDNSAGGNGTLNANIEFFHQRNLFLVDNDAGNPLTVANRETMVQLLDDHTATAAPLAPGSQDLGVMYDLDSTYSTNGSVWIEMAYPASIKVDSDDATPVVPTFSAAAVMLSLGANTGTGTGTLTVTATGALTTAQNDAVPPTAGMRVFIQPGTTNVANIDAGPWILSVVGGTGVSPVVTRPPEFKHGQLLIKGLAYNITGGSVYAGTTWVATAASATVVDTTDCAFYCRDITFQAKLGGTATASQTLSANQPVGVTNYPLTGGTASASPCPIGLMPLSGAGAAPAQGPQVVCSLATRNGTNTATVGYGILAQPTPGYVGTAAVTVNSIIATMVVNTNADTSTLNVTITNPC